VARAKRTQRADARRRYRAASAPTDAIDATETVDEGDAAPAGKSAAPSTAKSTGTPPRMGIFDALRASIRPIHVREDVASVPWIAVHSKALWLPALITVVSTIAIIITGGTDVITVFLFTYFVQTPAIGGVFIAGFLAPRASWLLGVIIGFLAAIGYSIYIVIAASRATGTDVPAPGLVQATILSALVLSPILGAFFAAAAAWYRRFLYLSNPNRGRNAQKGTQKRSADGRTRGSGTSQKASAKR
jgi:hypothetical protein